jgi:RND superfamily putative drug exporter
VLPLAGGVLSVLGAFTLLRAINSVLPLSSFALNLVIGLGLGLAVDYSLFMVSRFREELGRGAATSEALHTTMHTAGRAVVFSALTVAAATASLTVFPLGFLRSMGVGGAVVAIVAATVALTIMPALMVLLGRRIGAQRVRPDAEGGWYRLARVIMRRPGAVAAVAGAVLLLAALPDLRAHWSGVDASVLPVSRSARVVSDTVAGRFPQADPNPLVIAVSAPASAAPDLHGYATALSRQANVLRVGEPAYLGANTWSISASTTAPAIGAGAQRAVEAIRALPSRYPVAVGGEPALFHDQQAAIANGLPLALALLALSTLLILWLMTGSVILPVKALVMNALTVGAATGLLVLVFQDGRLTGPLGFSRPAGLESSDFLVLAALVFALSTDYGVFLLTRIKELRDRGLEDREAVALGLQRTGGLVTAASLLLAVAIGAFATSQIVFLKEIGLGTAAGVLLDAFIVRTFLVPSLMGLLGRWNWWAPAPLLRLHKRLAVSEGLRAAPAA